MKEFERIRHMSSRELALFGMQDLAYVKPVVVNGVTAFAVHAADGTQVDRAARPRCRPGDGAPARSRAVERSLNACQSFGSAAGSLGRVSGGVGEKREKRVGIVGAAQLFADGTVSQ